MGAVGGRGGKGNAMEGKRGKKGTVGKRRALDFRTWIRQWCRSDMDCGSYVARTNVQQTKCDFYVSVE